MLYMFTPFYILVHLIVCSILQIRLTESQQQKMAQEDMKPEQLDKLIKLEGWRKEVKHLEDKKSEMAAS